MPRRLVKSGVLGGQIVLALHPADGAYKAWLTAQPEGFIDGVEQAALDPFRGYANAIRDGLPDAVAVLDAFHVVRLGTQVVDEVRCRVQQDTRGHKDDPLYKICGLLRHGVEHLTERQQAKISACLDAGVPAAEVNLAWQCYQQRSSIYHAAPAKGREIAIKVLDSFHICPIPEVARSAAPCAPGGPRCWPTSIPRCLQRRNRSHHLIIEKVRRLAHGFKDLITTDSESCSPPTAEDRTEIGQPMPKSEDPAIPAPISCLDRETAAPIVDIGSPNYRFRPRGLPIPIDIRL